VETAPRFAVRPLCQQSGTHQSEQPEGQCAATSNNEWVLPVPNVEKEQITDVMIKSRSAKNQSSECWPEKIFVMQPAENLIGADRI